MATFIDKVKSTIGTKKMREKKQTGYSSETKDVLAKIPGSEVKPKPKAREEWTKSAGAELKTGKRPENGGRKVVTPASTKSAPTAKKSSSAFPTYKKDSEQAKSFRSAFAAANKAKKKTFTWEGRTYSTAKKK